MFRNLYHELTLEIVYFGFLASILVFSMILIEYDCFTIGSFFDSAWYVLITMTTVGYGDIYTKNVFGRITMTFCTFIGAICTSIYLTAVKSFMDLDEYGRSAFAVTLRSHIRKNMQTEVGLWLVCELKIRLELKKDMPDKSALLFWRAQSLK